MSRQTEADARIVVDDRLRQAGWDPLDKSMVGTEVQAADPSASDLVADRSRARPFATHAPVYDLVAAAGDFGPDRMVGAPGDEIGWAPVPESVRLTPEHFVARVSGRSMEPTIRDGSHCLFRTERGGSRQGKLVLVWQRGVVDPALGGEFSVKKYESTKAASAEGDWSHHEIRLKPLNPDPTFRDLVFSPDAEGDIRVVGEFVAVLDLPRPSTARGRADYVLHDQRARPLAVIEAKRNAINPYVAKQQALPYAKALGAVQDLLPAYSSYWLRAGAARQEQQITIALLQTMIGRADEYTAGFFDVVITDECHRSIYCAWQAALTRFDALHIGLTATPAAYIERITYDFFRNHQYLNDSDTDVFTGPGGGRPPSDPPAPPKPPGDLVEPGLEDEWLQAVTYVEVGPEGERADKEQYVSDWQETVRSRAVDDSLLRKVRDDERLDPEEEDELARRLNQPEHYFNEENLRRAYRDPGGTLIDMVDYVVARYSEEPDELPSYGEDWLERREQTLEEARKEIPSLQTYRKGSGEKIPDWPRFEASIHGTDVSRSMMRISMMNLALHGIRRGTLKCANVLSEMSGLSEDDRHRRYRVILSNPPFAGQAPRESLRQDLPTRSKKSELLFLALMLRSLAPGGRCAVVVPGGVLFGSTRAHKDLREKLLRECELLAVVSLPAGVFKPYSGVKTSVLAFRRPTTEPAEERTATGNAWFYDLRNDGYDPDRIQAGGRPETPEKNDIPGLLASWTEYKASDFRKAPGVEAGAVLDPGSDEARCWWAPSGLISENDYNLAASRYKPQVAEELPDEDPAELIREVLASEREITVGLEKLLEEVEQ